LSNQARPLSKYRMIIELARGGMGDVYLAVSRGPGGFHKLVVIKELRSALATDGEFLTMFMEEAKLSARLHHPNIVQTNEVGQDGNRYFMAMEYLEGQALNRCAQRIPKEEFTLAHHLRILVDALGGLHYAHELADYDGTPLHIVHRDISPHNILVTYDGQAKIVDFGIAKTRESAQQTATGVLKGKVPYMAPEQLDRNQDRRADIFAVGVMLWEAIAGRRMWAGKTDLGIVQALAEMKIPSIREGKPDVPEALERIVSMALAPNRDKRYQNALEFGTELEAYLDAMSSHVSNKQIGKLLSTTFAAEREQIRSVIEEQLKQVRVADSDQFVAAAEIPKLDLAQGAEYTPSDGHHSSGKTPAAALLNVPGGTQTGSRSGANAFPAPAPGSSGKTKMGVLIAGGVALAAGVLIWNGARGGHDAPSAPAAASTAVPAAPEATLVDLVVKVVPDDAQLYVDDVAVPGNPYKTRVPKGGYHQIRAEAPGFVPALEMRSMESDAVMNLVLERVKSDTGAKRPAAPAPRGPAPRSAPASRPASATPTPAATSTAAPHSIDTSDPYSR
jgi:serine/threonine protein kinase